MANEKYKGDALLQKTYTADYLTKKLKVNNGEVPQYYIEDDHEAIISPEVFDRVQIEIARRSKSEKKFSGVSIFSSKVRCGDCGSWYGSKVWHSNDKYRRVVFRCNNKYCDGRKCTSPHFSEDDLKSMFLKAMNLLLSEKEELILNLEECMEQFCETIELKRQQETLAAELEVEVGIIQDMVAENARRAQNQKAYQARYEAEVTKYEEIRKHYGELDDRIRANNARLELFQGFIQELRSLEGVLQKFDEKLFGLLVDEILVKSKDHVTFKFVDGTEITV